jgi:inner membrane protein
MATLGHAAFGLVAARALHPEDRFPPLSSLVFWSALSIVPDLDLVGYALGVPYGDAWGHRGATHSIAFAAVAALLVGFWSWRKKSGFSTAFVAALLVVGSHPVLDSLTDGGLGPAFLWPFSTERFFASWNPLSAAPFGTHFFARGGVRVLLVEALEFAPVFLFALWPRDGVPETAEDADVAG